MLLSTTPLNVSSSETKSIHVRAAIDIGMGGPKLHVAEVDVKTGKVIKTLFSQRYFINFYEDLSKNANHFSMETMQHGLSALKHAIEDASAYHPEKIIALATASFRSASNGMQYAEKIEAETGIKVHVVDQNLEGILTYQAILSKIGGDAESLIVWDIGGGSIQFTTQIDGSHVVDCGHAGVGSFNDHIITKIQQHSLETTTSPNPMSFQDIQEATDYAQSLSQKINDVFKNKIQNPNITIVGAGSVFGHGIANLLKQHRFDAYDLKKVVEGLSGKTDADLGGGEYAFCEATNAVLALGYMQGLKIHKMLILNANNADGALVYQPFWEPISTK